MFTDHTHKQRDYSDVEAAERLHENIDYLGSPVHELIRDLPIRKLTDLLRRNGNTLDGKRILIVGCGLGTDDQDTLGVLVSVHLSAKR